MKSVLISIQPKWCELIASGEKTVEVRKTRPRLETPFKCYIYQTKKGKVGTGLFTADGEIMGRSVKNGKVIGEFVCDNIRAFDVPYPAFQKKMDKDILVQSGCTYYQLHRYAWHDCLFAWHISDLVIYDKPRELSEFIVPSKTGCANEGKCTGCIYLDKGNGYNIEDDCSAWFDTDEYKPITRPPQSWCYVESEVEGNESNTQISGR